MLEILEIPKDVTKSFTCIPETMARLNIWGNGSCFFHSIAILLVVQNQVVDNVIRYTLQFPPGHHLESDYLTIEVPKTSEEAFYKYFEKVGLALRNVVCDSLSEEYFKKFEQESFSTDLKEQIDSTNWMELKGGLKSPHKWADIWSIKYTAWLLNLNILFINGSDPQHPLFCGVENFNKSPWTLFVYWVGRVHFEPIVQVNGSIVERRIFPTDHEWIQCIQKEYESGQGINGCSIKLTN